MIPDKNRVEEKCDYSNEPDKIASLNKTTARYNNLFKKI